MKAYYALYRRSDIMDFASIADFNRVMSRYLNEVTEGRGVPAWKMEPVQLMNIVTVLSTLICRPCGVQKALKVSKERCKRAESGASSAVSSAYSSISS